MPEPGAGLNAEICVEVACATPLRAIVRSYRLPAPVTIAVVLRLAAADPAFAGIDLLNSPVGVFGRVATVSQLLAHGDRVEIYRPLAADPKHARRARARDARKKPSG